MTSRFSVIDLSSLGPMRVLEEIDTDMIIDARMAKLVEFWRLRDPPAAATYDVGMLEFDPLKINQEASTYFELLLRDRVNQAARAVTLAFGSGPDLDAIATRYPGGVPRLPVVSLPRGNPISFPDDWETDTRYRQRIWLSPNPLAPHGTPEAYEFWAMTALPTLRDASVTKVRPRLQEDPIIIITCLADGANPKPSDSQLLQVRSYIMDERRRGVTDVILIRPPVVLETQYKIALELFPGPDREMVLAMVRSKIEVLVASQYWLGFDHTRMAIDAAIAQPGVHRAIIREPAQDIIVGDTQVVKVTAIEIEYLGRGE